ncbi:chmp2a2, partial [Symbiodinium sp. KB8]
EQIRENKRQINRAIREIDRERVALERQQGTLEVNLKKAARENQMATVNIMAKDYVRTKRNIQRFYQMRTQMQGVALKIQTMSSVEAMNTAMRGATTAMMRMNKSMNLPSMQRIAREFAMQSERMEMSQEMMSDAVDDAMEGDEDDLEEDALVQQVLGELNIDTMSTLGSLDAPTAQPASAAAATAAPTAGEVGPRPRPPLLAVAAVGRRLNNLRK